MTGQIAEVWCAKCDQPATAEFEYEGSDETVALCKNHVALAAWQAAHAPQKGDK